MTEYIETKGSSHYKLNICFIFCITVLNILEVFFTKNCQPYVSVLKSQKIVGPNGEKYSSRAV